MGERYRIGEWEFDVDGAALIGAEGERRLEDRAARTLALLCRWRGEIVSQQAILEHVWNGRAVSPNSVAVVIGDLRRELGDDAREPNHIVTISKRGYRLNAVAPPPDRRPTWLASLAGLAALSMGLLVLAFVRSAEPSYNRFEAPSPRTVAVASPENSTGSGRYQPLAQALGALIVDRVRRQCGTSVITGKPGGESGAAGLLTLRSRLILWNGQPTLSLTATDEFTGKVEWSEMVPGPEEALATHTIAALGRFERVTDHRQPCSNPYGIMV